VSLCSRNTVRQYLSQLGHNAAMQSPPSAASSVDGKRSTGGSSASAATVASLRLSPVRGAEDEHSAAAVPPAAPLSSAVGSSASVESHVSPVARHAQPAGHVPPHAQPHVSMAHAHAHSAGLRVDSEGSFSALPSIPEVPTPHEAPGACMHAAALSLLLSFALSLSWPCAFVRLCMCICACVIMSAALERSCLVCPPCVLVVCVQGVAAGACLTVAVGFVAETEDTPEQRRGSVLRPGASESASAGAATGAESGSGSGAPTAGVGGGGGARGGSGAGTGGGSGSGSGSGGAGGAASGAGVGALSAKRNPLNRKLPRKPADVPGGPRRGEKAAPLKSWKLKVSLRSHAVRAIALLQCAVCRRECDCHVAGFFFRVFPCSKCCNMFS
jgi:hypothetical protein